MKQREKQKIVILAPTTPKRAVRNAKREILEERKGEQLGLKTRWESLNRANRKYFRFKQIYLLAGLSGHGKSYILNLIINDFFDKHGINKEFKDPFIVLYFCYEMSAVDEVLRTAGSKMNVSYSKILSSEWNRDDKKYEGLTEEELVEVFEVLDKIANRPLYYFETAGNLLQLEATVSFYSNKYPGVKIVVAIDHTLLSEMYAETTIIELMSNTARVALRLKKVYHCMVLMLGQLNNKIEEYSRIKEPAGQYPIKSDIYAQAQLYNACDGVLTIHQPSLLKIQKYGLKKLGTRNLIHLQYLKARHGLVGSIWLENRLNEGNIVERKIKELQEIPQDKNKDDNILA